MVGTTDYNKEFHPFGVLITKNETDNDFGFMFKRIKELVQKIHTSDYNPTSYWQISQQLLQMVLHRYLN